MQKVDQYLKKKQEWKEELELLRKLLNQSELSEDFKWSVPTYTLNKKNVIGMAGFKSYVGLWFFQGVFLSDPHQLLVNAQENKTKGLRQLRFTSIKEMDPNVLTTYIEEAIQNQKEGKEIKVERVKKIKVGNELDSYMKENTALKKAFTLLTVSKQKEYNEYISTAKQEKTKHKRLEKITPLILEGVGLHDKYKNC